MKPPPLLFRLMSLSFLLSQAGYTRYVVPLFSFWDGRLVPLFGFFFITPLLGSDLLGLSSKYR